MKPSRLTVLVSAFLVTLLIDSGMSPTWADPGPKWREIEKLLVGEPQEKGSQKRKALQFLKEGHVALNVHTGYLRFHFRHLPFLPEPSDLGFGTQAAISLVKGTVICQVSAGAGATLVDTPALPVTGQGPVTFSGHVSLPRECVSAPHDLFFAVRTVTRGQRADELQP